MIESKNNELKHIGLIPDGNRRWALQKRIDYYSAYTISANVLDDFVNTAIENIPELEMISIYVMSKKNLRRQRDDLAAVIDAFSVSFAKMLYEKTMPKHNIATNIIRTQALPQGDNIPENMKESFERFYNAFVKLENLKPDSHRKVYKLNLLVGYDTFEEIYNALLKKEHPFDFPIKIEDMLVPQRVDLVIRTSGEQRYSDFLPLQAGYAEFIFVKEYFQDLNKTLILNSINEYGKRKRRFGS